MSEMQRHSSIEIVSKHMRERALLPRMREMKVSVVARLRKASAIRAYLTLRSLSSLPSFLKAILRTLTRAGIRDGSKT